MGCVGKGGGLGSWRKWQLIFFCYFMLLQKKKNRLWISLLLWNVLISVEFPCIIQDCKMIWISGADRFSDEDFKLCNYETHIG